MKFVADVIDEACEQLFGHTNWAYAGSVSPEQLKTEHTAIIFFHEPEDEDSDEN